MGNLIGGLMGKLDEEEVDFKRNTVISKPILQKQFTILESMIADNDEIDELLNTHPNSVSYNSVIISIILDRQKHFDLCIPFIIRDNLQYFDEPNLTNIVKYCGQSSNIHYFRTVHELILIKMDAKLSLPLYRSALSIAAKRGDITILELLESEQYLLPSDLSEAEPKFQRNLGSPSDLSEAEPKFWRNLGLQQIKLYAAYGAISGDQMNVLRWLFDHTLPVYSCLLDACVYLDRIDMFREFNTLNDRYIVNKSAMDIVLKEKRHDMFLEIINHNYSPKSHDEEVLDYCMELNMRDKMVDLIIIDEGDNIEPEAKHIRYITQDSKEFERLVLNYKNKNGVIADILCYAVTDQNITEILELAKTVKRSITNDDTTESTPSTIESTPSTIESTPSTIESTPSTDDNILTVTDIVTLVSVIRDESVILNVFTEFKYLPDTNIPSLFFLSDDDINDIAYAIGHDSNIMLLNVLINRYGFKINKRSLNQITSVCNSEMFVFALKNTDKYNPASIVDSLMYKARNKFTKCEIELILDTILAKYPDIELSDFNVMNINKLDDTEFINMFITKLKLTPKQLLAVITYDSTDICFYHICNKYLRDQPSKFKSDMATELGYKCDDMIKKELPRLIFLLNELNVPLEFKILEAFGKVFGPNRWHILSILSDDNRILTTESCEQIEKLIRLCTERSLVSLKKQLK